MYQVCLTLKVQRFLSAMLILKKVWHHLCVSAGVCWLAVEPADGPVQPSQTEISQCCPPTGAPQWRLWGMNAHIQYAYKCFVQVSSYFSCFASLITSLIYYKHTHYKKSVVSAVIRDLFCVYSKWEASPICRSVFANRW